LSLVESSTIKPPPDFRWADRCCDTLVNALENLWDSLVRIIERRIDRYPVLRVVGRIVVYFVFAYLVLLWASACYVFFPISPYGFWNIAGWIFIAGVLIVVSIVVVYSVFLGVVQLGLLLSLVLLLLLWLTLSLFYLSYIVVAALRTNAAWILPYRSVIVASVICVMALATYVDGTNRFWDRQFELLPWLKLCFLGLSGWAALFCWIARDRVLEPGTPRRILIWSLGLVLALGLLAYWTRNNNREEYFLNKAVTQNPRDPQAWLDLAWHYDYEGDRLADEEGDEDHAPPDPTPDYSEALRCFNRAAELGASGFEMNLARAQLADTLGEKRNAVAYAQEALRFAPTDGAADETADSIEWLHKTIDEDRNSPNRSEVSIDRRKSTEKQRIQRLPLFVRWVFDLLW
jgi:tetratricopeptide (TPR) repeat protein